jgi:hypothetical protein
VRPIKRSRLDGVHLPLARDPVSGEFWAIVSSLPTTLQTLRQYGLRFDIEENFRIGQIELLQPLNLP